MNLMYFDGAPCAVKVACTVLSGGKSGDHFKGLPIAIRCEVPGYEAAHGGRRRCPHRHHSRASALRSLYCLIVPIDRQRNKLINH